jgi:integrase/recombinase XerD
MGKGKKERSIPLPEPTMILLSEYIKNVYWKLLPENAKELIRENYLFPIFVNGKIQNISRQSIWSILKKLLIVSGIKKNISPHSLRHSLATHMLKNGVNVRFLQMLLGHEQISTVQVYTHLETSNLRKIYDKAHPRA